MTREKAIKILSSYKNSYFGDALHGGMISVSEIIELLSAQTEIIHCRDCKHKPSGDGANHDITFPDWRCPCQCEDYWYSWIPNDDWYCGDAERREDE